MINSSILLQTENSSSMVNILMIVVLIAIFYFFMIRPQQKKQKELKKQREALQTGSKVVTAGGIHGKIKEINDTCYVIEISQGVSIKVDKNSIYPLVDTPAPKK